MADNDSGVTGGVTGELLTQLADLPVEQALATLAASGLLTPAQPHRLRSYYWPVQPRTRFRWHGGFP